MKYIKQYEKTQFSKYQIDDYVLLKPYMDNISHLYQIYNNWGHIIGSSLGQVDRILTHMYDVDFIDSTSFEVKNIKSNYVLEPDILRELTKKEIEEFKMMSEVNKYNL